MPLSLAAVQEQHAASGPLAVERGLMIWTVVVFLLLLLILRKFAWPALLGAVEAREQALEEQLDEAERNRAESAAAGGAQEAARRSAGRGPRPAGRGADRRREGAGRWRMEKTRQEQEELLARARRDIAAERDRAVEELRREAVDLSLAAASKLIGERLDQRDRPEDRAGVPRRLDSRN